MPCIKSKAQMRKLFAMEERGELPKGTAERMAHETKEKHHKSLKKLPEKKHKSKKASAEIDISRLPFDMRCQIYAYVRRNI